MAGIGEILQKLKDSADGTYAGGRAGGTASKGVFAGFDGFIDTIARPVRSADANGEGVCYFSGIEEFGNYISRQGHRSSSIELHTIEVRPGGNMPNFSRAMGTLGADITCAGMLSNDEGTIHSAFSALPAKLYSYAPAGSATALEFSDGKIFLSPTCTLPGDPLDLIRASMEPVPLETVLGESGLIAFLNWSELPFAHNLWKDLYTLSAAALSPDKGSFIFFDLCDPSRKTPRESGEVLELIESFSALRTTILSLNRNEALILSGRIKPSGGEGESLADCAVRIRERFSIDEVLVHSHHESLVLSKDGMFSERTQFTERPVISTGAGDAFNAAYCFAALHGLDCPERIVFANRYAHSYITSGKLSTLDGV